MTIRTARGEQTVVHLPDRSTVTLNAESKISYKPFIWFIATHTTISRSSFLPRKVSLEGEAFFEVTTGSRFSVQTGNNRVNVLGTTFNVHARPGVYRITCLSGQVEVQAGLDTVVLHPDMQAVLREQKLMVTRDASLSLETGWMRGMFVFSATPLGEVIAEIERRYDIHVTADYDPNLLFTGNFSEDENPLEVIGKAFGITLSLTK
jgi:ferric-dicitrate binding protein FerR (iron transport regulator)